MPGVTEKLVTATDDDKQKVTDGSNALGGAVALGIGGLALGPLGAIGGAVLGAIAGSDSATDHDRTLARAVEAAAYAADEHGGSNASVYFDHDPDSGVTDDLEYAASLSAATTDDIDGRPDIVYDDPGGETRGALVEVETLERIQDDPKHVTGQLQRYRRTGYSTALIVPTGEGAESWEWLENRHDVPDQTYVVEAPAFCRFLNSDF
jgi:hypothetical protein